MRVSDESVRQIKLNELVKEMMNGSLSAEQEADFLDSLCLIYTNGFRHSYSAFFSIIADVPGESLDMLSYNIEKLRHTLDNIHFEINCRDKSKYSSLYRNFVKLSDHLNIEISRVQFYSEQKKKNEHLYEQISSVRGELEDASDNANKIKTSVFELSQSLGVTEEKSKKVEDSLERSQISAITVIGLFSAIIMSFLGGISFSGQALEALSMASPIRLVFVLSLIGFILFNLLFLVLYIIGKLTGRKICSQCLNSTDQTKKVCTCQDKPLWCKLIKRYPYVLWTNVVLLFLLVDMALIWVSSLFFNRAINPVWVMIITCVLFAMFTISAIIFYRTNKNTKK